MSQNFKSPHNSKISFPELINIKFVDAMGNTKQ